jgi:hypothetical protein
MKMYVKKQDGRVKLDTSSTGYRPMAGSFEHGIKLSGDT